MIAYLLLGSRLPPVGARQELHTWATLIAGNARPWCAHMATLLGALLLRFRDVAREANAALTKLTLSHRGRQPPILKALRALARAAAGFFGRQWLVGTEAVGRLLGITPDGGPIPTKTTRRPNGGLVQPVADPFGLVDVLDGGKRFHAPPGHNG